MGAGPPCLNSLNECFIVHDVRNIVDFAFLSSDQELSFYCLALIGFFLGGGGGQLRTQAFCFRGWMVSEKGPGLGWSVLQPYWSMILNVIIQYMWE
jgi:hypothetical protein